MGGCKGHQRYIEHKDSGTKKRIFLIFQVMIHFI
jgi:hypothetical protein